MSDRPLVAVGAVAVSHGELLLIQRANPPQQHRWSLPGGRVERGELLMTAVVREMREETGIEAVCGPFLGWVERIGADHHIVIFDFEVTVLDHQPPRAGDDALGAAWVRLEHVAELDLADGLAEFLAEHGVIDAIV